MSLVLYSVDKVHQRAMPELRGGDIDSISSWRIGKEFEVIFNQFRKPIISTLVDKNVSKNILAWPIDYNEYR